MRFWNFKNAAREDGAGAGAGAGAPDGVLDIDGEIVAEEGWMSEGACVAKDFRKALGAYRNVTVRINSPGGDVMAGADIYSALREHSLNGRGRVTVFITALAASAASVIAMAGDEIIMSPTAYMMIHNPWTIAMGDAREMRKTAKTLDVISEGLINAYQIRTGKSRDELKRMLENETWMSAYTCLEQGFIDKVFGTSAAAEDGPRAVACLMAGRSHGWQEIAAKYAPKAEETEETEPDKDPEKGGDPASDPEDAEAGEHLRDADGENPEEDPEEDPEGEEDGDPEEDPDGDPEETDADPEEDPEEEPEDPEEARKNALARAAAIGAALEAWDASFFGDEA